MSETSTETMTTADAHLRAFDALRPVLPGHGQPWIDNLRADALRRFEAAGLPNRRLEAWKFTRLGPLEGHAFTPAVDAGPVPTLKGLPELAECAARLVFVDGRFDAAMSDLPNASEGISITTLAEALRDAPASLEGHLSKAADPAGALLDLNAAFMADGAVVRLADGAVLDKPIHLVFLSSAADDMRANHIRNVIELGRDARAQVVETYAAVEGASASSFTNAVTDISLAESAALTHVRVQDEAIHAVHAVRAAITLAGSSEYAGFTLAMGGEVSRHETEAAFTAPKGRVRLMGGYLGRGRQIIDHTTRIDHGAPDCETDELFKGVMDDRARGVFQGLIRVAPHAVGTDARQKNQALLLSDRAAADTKPELEILNDAVKCAHGATVGDLDKDALYYLMTRGVPEHEARRLLVAGFIGEVIDRFDSGMIGAYLMAWVSRWQDRKEQEGGGHA